MSVARYGLLVALIAVSCPGESFVLAGDDERHIREALHALSMDLQDLGFEKDVGEPERAYGGIRAMLHDPLKLPLLGDRLIAAARERSADVLWRMVFEWREVVSPPDLASHTEIAWDRDAVEDEALTAALDDFMESVARARNRVHPAFEGLSPEDLQYLAARHLVGAVNAEDRVEARQALINAGVSGEIIQSVIAESEAIDPAPAVRRAMDLAARIDQGDLMRAGDLLVGASHNLRRATAEVTRWPREKLVIETELGALLIGTVNADVYDEAALLILDPGGHDAYLGSAGAANGLKHHPISVVIDLAGNDVYDSDALLAAGAAQFGVSVLLDVAGDDMYRAAYVGQGSGLFGAGWMEDQAGDDVYRAGLFAQGAGVHGFGVLIDEAGNDLYDVGLCGQAYAGTLGVGLLIDHAGDDLYRAGGRERDHERHPDRYLSLSQGFSIGHRPFVGGGYAALIDLSGNDTYIADVFGQGASYWYSVGLLLDLEGQDTYRVHHYGQGAGVHMSLGLLYDGAGGDVYDGHILAQGSAHDYGVGMLIDHGGQDVFTGDHHVQGRAVNNSLALLLNRGGDDAYFAAQPLRAQGIGNDGDRREYGSISLLIDPDGRDTYSTTVREGEIRVRPSHGVIFNTPLEQEHEN